MNAHPSSCIPKPLFSCFVFFFKSAGLEFIFLMWLFVFLVPLKEVLLEMP